MLDELETPLRISEHLLDHARSNHFAGYDPFDSLNSRLLKATPLYQSEWVRLAWLQLGKRSPINLRPLLRVPKRRNPKGVALFILGLIEDFRRTRNESYLESARELATWLLQQQSDKNQWKYSCWGYHFDWQARAFFVPTGKPNVITTCYVARALFELGKIDNNNSLIEIALDAARFIYINLYTEADGRCFYAYIPGEKAFVHNASLWGAAWCAFAGQELGDEKLTGQALRVARQSVHEQFANGSWVYGARHHHKFIDGFHTGYNLEALTLMRDTLKTDEFDAPIRKGYRFYIENLFDKDGTAKYYNTSAYPIDMHNFAQAVFTLLRVGGQSEDLKLCETVLQRAIELLYLPNKGQFIYQRTRFLTNRINYTRWTQAWAYYSLAYYNRYRSELDNAKN